MNEKYNFALDKEYLTYGECKKLGYSESASRENDLKRQLKEIRLLEEEIGLPLEFILSEVIGNVYYYIDDSYVYDEIATGLGCEFDPHKPIGSEIGEWIIMTNCCGVLKPSDYKKTWWLSEEEAERALKSMRKQNMEKRRSDETDY